MLTPKEDPPSRVAKHEEIATYVESILRNIIHAVNTRNFNPKTSPWNDVIADYRIGCPHTPRLDLVATKPAWIQSLEDFTRLYPDSHITIDCLTSSVSQNSGHAKVFMECRVTGGPGFPRGSMSKPAMSMYEFQFVEELGKWVFVKETSVTGAPVCVPWMDGEVSVWGGG